jgi:hypothetical protein
MKNCCTLFPLDVSGKIAASLKLKCHRFLTYVLRSHKSLEVSERAVSPTEHVALNLEEEMIAVVMEQTVQLWVKGSW